MHLKGEGPWLKRRLGRHGHSGSRGGRIRAVFGEPTHGGNRKTQDLAIEISSSPVKRLHANPPFASRGSVEMDSSLINGLLELGHIDTQRGDRICEGKQLRRPAGWTGRRLVALKSACVRQGGRILIFGRASRRRKDGDFAMFDVKLDSSFLLQSTSESHTLGPANSCGDAFALLISWWAGEGI